MGVDQLESAKNTKGLQNEICQIGSLIFVRRKRELFDKIAGFSAFTDVLVVVNAGQVVWVDKKEGIKISDLESALKGAYFAEQFSIYSSPVSIPLRVLIAQNAQNVHTMIGGKFDSKKHYLSSLIPRIAFIVAAVIFATQVPLIEIFTNFYELSKSSIGDSAYEVVKQNPEQFKDINLPPESWLERIFEVIQLKLFTDTLIAMGLAFGTYFILKKAAIFTFNLDDFGPLKKVTDWFDKTKCGKHSSRFIIRWRDGHKMGWRRKVVSIAIDWFDPNQESTPRHSRMSFVLDVIKGMHPTLAQSLYSKGMLAKLTPALSNELPTVGRLYRLLKKKLPNVKPDIILSKNNGYNVDSDLMHNIIDTSKMLIPGETINEIKDLFLSDAHAPHKQTSFERSWCMVKRKLGFAATITVGIHLDANELVERVILKKDLDIYLTLESEAVKAMQMHSDWLHPQDLNGLQKALLKYGLIVAGITLVEKRTD